MFNYLSTIRIQILLIAVLLGVLVGPRFFAHGQGGGEGPDTLGVDTQLSKLPSPPTHPPTAMPSIEGRAAFVWDIREHRVIFAKNAYEKLPLASVTKMMVALTASELLAPDAKITIHSEDLAEEGDTGLQSEEIWTFKKLLDLTLVTSSNDGASKIAAAAGAQLFETGTSTDPAVSKKAFIDRMNRRARALGLDDTSFRNATGLDLDNATGGAYGSARDMGMLFEYIWRKHPEVFGDTNRHSTKVVSENKIVHDVKNTNLEVGSYMGVIGSKTGYTELAGGNLVVILDAGLDHPIVVSVLGSTREGRFNDVRVLSEAALRSIAEHPSNP